MRWFVRLCSWFGGLKVVDALSLVFFVVGCGSKEGQGKMEVWDIQPRAGATSGDQPVRILGKHFRQDIGYIVYFGAVRATSVTILDPSTLLVVTPQHEPGPVDVVVVAENGPAFRIQQGYTFAEQGGNVLEQVGQPQKDDKGF
ncbi:MAG: IPT/TIG domain-containing protein [Sandaracinaceae bacterium]|nr:IPT/TIG domain-containing protein [Sandaracinaceae bacterium]